MNRITLSILHKQLKQKKLFRVQFVLKQRILINEIIFSQIVLYTKIGLWRRYSLKNIKINDCIRHMFTPEDSWCTIIIFKMVWILHKTILWKHFYTLMFFITLTRNLIWNQCKLWFEPVNSSHSLKIRPQYTELMCFQAIT